MSPVLAASPDKYASSSVLSSGNWVKIEITTPGIQTLSRQTLKNFGFNDPAKVRVYGYGGRMTPEILRTDLPDDLPEQPVVRNSDGSISFYATGNISFRAANSTMVFNHTINPYCDNSYYFLSDREPISDTDPNSNIIDLSGFDGMDVTSYFISQLVHEQDLIQCADSGRDYFGEDFRSAKSQDFKFDLPDNIDGKARIRIRFATNTSGASSSILVSANGQRLPASNTDKISAVSSSGQYYAVTSTIKEATDVGNSLNVGIEYSQAGVVSMARLDWIEVEYQRELRLHDSQLYFCVNAKRPTAYCISDVTPQTVLWDVTDPANVKVIKGHFNSSDNTLTIGIKSSGLREFIAFDPSIKGASVPGRIKIANQDIHALSTPDMVIISPNTFTSAAEKIANIHRQHDGMTVYVLSPDKIFNEFSGGHPDVSAFRKLLKMWYDRSSDSQDGNKFKYCLLMGRPTYDQKHKNPETLKANYSTTLIWQSSGGLSETTSYCTDDFIAMLEDETSNRSMYSRNINVAVGRYPVTSVNDANIIAQKLEDYINDNDYGIWRNNVMVIADDGDRAQHLLQAQKSIEHMQLSDAGTHYAYERLYLDAYELKKTGTGNEFPDAKQRMLKKWQNEGVAFINYIGHANPKEWGHEKLMTWEDINSMSNQHLPILYAATCSFGKWDAESVSGAEIMLKNPAGGAIAIITPSRSVYITQNEYITNSISDQVFHRDDNNLGQRIGDILRLGKNNCSLKTKTDNVNRYHLFGDPALRMPTPKYSIQIDSLAGQPLVAIQADAPSLKARSTVEFSGRIVDVNGNTVDFNGPVQFVLFDAEKSVETHGWGEDGVVSTYQDRSSKLATGSALVVNGFWTAKILMPSEIANNYTPAFLTLYAFDKNLNSEANGSTDKLFVYGYDYKAGDDIEGPVIERFVINSDSFSDGDLSHANSVVFASFSDESGINISDAGIGHKMSLTLDNDRVFDDISNYFTPDSEIDGKGSIAYPLSNLQPGEHSLTLSVWDNNNNSSYATINFKVGINIRPEIFDLHTLYDNNADVMTIEASTDRALSKLGCRFECYTLNGNLLWSSDKNIYSGKESTVGYVWDLKDANGSRVPRGIYILRVNVSSDEGIFSSKSKKIAIPAK